MEHPLRAWRRKNNVSLVALSERVGVAASHLSMVERWLRGVSIDLASRLVKATRGDVHLADFVNKRRVR